MIVDFLKDEWSMEKQARELTRENRRRIAAGEAYVNDNEKHKPILKVVK